MNAAEIVVHRVEGDRIGMVLNFFGEGVGEPGKAPHSHTHREILAFDEARRNVLRVGVSRYGFHFAACAGRRTVARFLLAGLIRFDQHSIVNVASERAFHRLQICLVAIGGQLNPMREPRSKIFNQGGRCPGVPIAKRPNWY